MKQIILMRTDTVPKMRKGKMVAQGAHASLGAVLPYTIPSSWREFFSRAWWRKHRKVRKWLKGSFTKVCVGATLQEIETVYLNAEMAGLITCLITDRGLTEFGGIPTVTALAVGPNTHENLVDITGGLQLL